MINPKDYGLHPKTVLEELGKKHFAIVIDRKSRFIMNDGHKFIEKVKVLQIQGIEKVSLKISSPMCSKTEKYLSELDIKILKV